MNLDSDIKLEKSLKTDLMAYLHTVKQKLDVLMIQIITTYIYLHMVIGIEDFCKHATYFTLLSSLRQRLRQRFRFIKY